MGFFDWLRGTPPTTPDELLAEARALVEQSRFPDAVQAYYRIARRDRTPAILLEMAWACYYYDNCNEYDLRSRRFQGGLEGRKSLQEISFSVSLRRHSRRSETEEIDLGEALPPQEFLFLLNIAAAPPYSAENT